MGGSLIVSIYDNIASLYEKWSSGDAVYNDSGNFYVSALKQMTEGNYLELGIGTGRIALKAIQFAPISVVGVDASKQMLTICKKKLSNLSDKKGTLRLINRDISNLSFYEEFDGAIMPFRTIGHLMTEDALNSLFKGVFAALKPGGWFLFDHYMFQQEWAEAHNNTNIMMYKDSVLSIYDNYSYDFEHKTMDCKVFVNDILFEQFDFRWLTPEDIYKSVKHSGFNVLSLMGEFDGSVWTEQSFEQIWFLRKPGEVVKSSRLPIFEK